MRQFFNQPASRSDYAEWISSSGNARQAANAPCGINQRSALCALCRYRHNTHWTGAPHRLHRVFGVRFGDRAYAFEELIGELGAAFLCSRFGIVNQPRADHAAYISSWLEILDRDRKAIFLAANQAQKAVEYLTQAVAAKTAN